VSRAMRAWCEDHSHVVHTQNPSSMGEALWGYMVSTPGLSDYEQVTTQASQSLDSPIVKCWVVGRKLLTQDLDLSRPNFPFNLTSGPPRA
jgi:hypothetical protein